MVRVDRLRPWYQRNRLDVALVALVLCVVAPWVHLVTAQVSSRYAFSAAIVEQQTIRLDDYQAILGIDRVEIDGHVYSDKAPGQPVLAVPAIAAGQALGAEPATVPRFRGNLGVWPATLVSSMIPLALLVVVMRRHAARVVGGNGVLAVLAVGGTTLLLPMGADLYSHVLSGLVGFGAWTVLSRAEDSKAVVIAGVLVGLGVTIEYPLLGIAGVLGIYLLVQRRIRHALYFAAAALPFVLAVGAYHWALLGDPTESPYTLKDGGRLHLLTLPGIDNTIDVFFGARGFVFTPIVLAGLVGLVLNRFWDRPLDPERLVAGAVVGGFLLLQIGWNNPWTGDSPGPRLVTPALPFLVVPCALVLQRLRTAFVVAIVGLGALAMGLALVTLQLLPHGAGLISGHVRNITDDRIGLGETLFTLAIGPAGWAVHLGLVALATAWLRVELRRPERATDPPTRAAA